VEKINEEYNLFKHYGLVTQTSIKFKSQSNLKCKLTLYTFQIISSVN